MVSTLYVSDADDSVGLHYIRTVLQRALSDEIDGVQPRN